MHPIYTFSEAIATATTIFKYTIMLLGSSAIVVLFVTLFFFYVLNGILGVFHRSTNKGGGEAPRVDAGACAVIMVVLVPLHCFLALALWFDAMQSTNDPASLGWWLLYTYVIIAALGASILAFTLAGCVVVGVVRLLQGSESQVGGSESQKDDGKKVD